MNELYILKFLSFLYGMDLRVKNARNNYMGKSVLVGGTT